MRSILAIVTTLFVSVFLLAASEKTYHITKTKNERIELTRNDFTLTFGEIELTDQDELSMVLNITQKETVRQVLVVYANNTPAIVEITGYRLVFSDISQDEEDNSLYNIELTIYPLY